MKSSPNGSRCTAKTPACSSKRLHASSRINGKKKRLRPLHSTAKFPSVQDRALEKQLLKQTWCSGSWLASRIPASCARHRPAQQLNDVLWAEIAKWQERSPVLQAMLVWTKTRVYMRGHEKRWFAVARTATKPENMQGFHEDNMLFVVDEASGRC